MKHCLILFGPPGVGKGTQSKLLSEKYNLKHISTGDILRAEIKAGTELGKRADSIIKGGNLLDDATVIEITQSALTPEGLEAYNGYILDGYPRTVVQAQAVKGFAARNAHDIMPVICLSADETVIVERIKARGIRPGESENVAEETAKRISVYYEQTKPLLEVFMPSCVSIDSTEPIDTVFNNITDILSKRSDFPALSK